MGRLVERSLPSTTDVTVSKGKDGNTGNGLTSATISQEEPGDNSAPAAAPAGHDRGKFVVCLALGKKLTRLRLHHDEPLRNKFERALRRRGWSRAAIQVVAPFWRGLLVDLDRTLRAQGIPSRGAVFCVQMAAWW